MVNTNEILNDRANGINGILLRISSHLPKHVEVFALRKLRLRISGRRRFAETAGGTA